MASILAYKLSSSTFLYHYGSSWPHGKHIQDPYVVQNQHGEQGENLREQGNKKRKEMLEYSSWSGGKNLFDQMHRLAISIGPAAVAHLKSYLQIGLDNLYRGRSLGIGSKNTNKDLLVVENDETEVMTATVEVNNPNDGNCRFGKRKKVFLERRKVKVGRKNVQTREGEQGNVAGSSAADQSTQNAANGNQRIVGLMVDAIHNNFHGNE